MPNETNEIRTNNRGQNLTPEARSKGGQNSSGNFKNNPQKASEAGRKGAESRVKNQG